MANLSQRSKRELVESLANSQGYSVVYCKPFLFSRMASAMAAAWFCWAKKIVLDQISFVIYHILYVTSTQ